MNNQSENSFFNREMSWLEFNQRVLNEAVDITTPTLERLKFLAISCSNLDEFFMVRVGGLQLTLKGRHDVKDAAGLLPKQQLAMIRSRVEFMIGQQYNLFNETLTEKLNDVGVKISHPRDLNSVQLDRIEQFFEQEVFGSLSPIASRETNFPIVPNLNLNILFRLNAADDAHRPLVSESSGLNDRFVVVPIGKKLPRFVFVPSEAKLDLVFVEEIIQHFAKRFFYDQEILESFAFRVTRNADMRINDEIASDLLVSMEDFLEERMTGDCVRLEIGPAVSKESLDYLKGQ
ncbi:MAG: RNA degradosome polyphosphate kinase, partial [Planctomycetota bacterium]|nr:RNA degradosome polyphosphate kinase [Planctomycetota bacterium]